MNTGGSGTLDSRIASEQKTGNGSLIGTKSNEKMTATAGTNDSGNVAGTDPNALQKISSSNNQINAKLPNEQHPNAENGSSQPINVNTGTGTGTAHKRRAIDESSNSVMGGPTATG